MTKYQHPIRHYMRIFAEQHYSSGFFPAFPADYFSLESFCSEFRNSVHPREWNEQTVTMNAKIMITNESKYRPNRKHYEQGWDNLLYMENGDLDRLRLYNSSKDPRPIPSDQPSKPITWPSKTCGSTGCDQLIEGPEAEPADKRTQRCPDKFPGCGKKWCDAHKPKFHPLHGEEKEVCEYCFEKLDWSWNGD